MLSLANFILTCLLIEFFFFFFLDSSSEEYEADEEDTHECGYVSEPSNLLSRVCTVTDAIFLNFFCEVGPYWDLRNYSTLAL